MSAQVFAKNYLPLDKFTGYYLLPCIQFDKIHPGREITNVDK